MAQLTTRFAKAVTADTVLQDYPRPQLVRSSYVNLNGLWDYAFTKDAVLPEKFDGRILVPFSPESALSGINRQLQPDEYLWYRRRFPLVKPQRGKKLLLHFGAVDQSCAVYINGETAGTHIGGYLPFTLDITDLVVSGENELLVLVQDLSDTSYHSRGKQKLQPGGMYYTAQSGIWQTVWMELVPDNYIESLRLTPDYDASTLHILVKTAEATAVSCRIPGCPDCSFVSNTEAVIPIPDKISWSPEHPHLYQLQLQTGQDRVSSYFAMRKCDIQTDKDGIRRIFLNNQPYIQTGVLDQGYYPESLYTPPCDEAMVTDIQSMKDLGFNMLRKHAKIEPDRWYYHCDRLGMLVWQDMVNGGTSYDDFLVTYLATLMSALHISMKDHHYKRLSRLEEEGRLAFLDEVRSTIDALYSHPCIVCWVPFNEGWGQFDANQVTDLIRSLDTTRLIDQASGWYDQKGGDFKSLHYYFFWLWFIREKKRAVALTEFGGYAWHVPKHSYADTVYGYKTFGSKEELTAGYAELLEKKIYPKIKKGLSALIYTQLSDVEEEVNGFYTYDREILKMDAAVVQQWNRRIREL